jgi:hypothetical protein
MVFNANAFLSMTGFLEPSGSISGGCNGLSSDGYFGTYV